MRLGDWPHHPQPKGLIMTETNQVRFLPAADADHEGTHIALTTGHACRVYDVDPIDGKRGTTIPQMFHKHAIAAGCGVVGIIDQVAQAPDPGRQGLVVDAIAAIIEQGNADDLTKDGRPKAATVNRVAGFTVIKEDLDAAWAVFVESLDDEAQ